jgi:hypothetical protein
MKMLLYRLPSSRSLTKLFSILSFAVVAFAALELLFVQQALAGVWCCQSSTASTAKCVCDASLACPTTFPRNTFKSCGVAGAMSNSGTINSTISCTGVSGSNFWDSTSVGQDAILDCTVADSADQSHNGRAFCKLNLLYSRPAGLLTQCTPVGTQNPGAFTRSHVAFCDQVSGGNAQNRLTVTGTLQCNHAEVQAMNSSDPDVTLDSNDLPTVCGGNTACGLNVGIAGQGGCSSTLFPFDNLNFSPPLAEGQVLRLTQTFNNSSCTDPPTDVSELDTRYCTGASFNGAPVDCTFGTGKTQEEATVIGTADNVLPFDVDFKPPQTLNLSCTGGTQSNDIWDFKIFGNQHLNVTLINVGSLKIEGVSPNPPITCSLNGTNNLLCEVKACPTVAPAVLAARDPVTLFVDITVTGTLNSGTPIIGQQHIKTSGQ